MSHRTLWRWTLLIVVAWSSGCAPQSKQATQVLLEIDAEPEVRAELSTLAVEIRGGSATDDVSDFEGEERSPIKAPRFPLHVGLVPLNKDATRLYDVTVTAYDKQARAIAQARIVSGYVAHALRFAKLVLQDRCLRVERCASADRTLTCADGACVEAYVAPEDLSSDEAVPTAPGGPEIPVKEMDGGMDDDGGTYDANALDATSKDADPEKDTSPEVDARTECQAEYWSPDPARATPCQARTACTPGQYVASPGDSTNDRRCAGCESGTFSQQANATACERWHDCSAGTYVTNSPSASVDRMCAACESGLTSTRMNQSSCLPPGSCPAGTKQIAPGGNGVPPSCSDCRAGEYCAGGTATPASCETGSWDHDLDPATACSAQAVCTPGQFIQAEGSSTANRGCGACSTGSFTASSNASSCVLWTSCGTGFSERRPGSTTTDRTCEPTPWTRQFAEVVTSLNETAQAVAVDSVGNAYVAGGTSRTGFLRKFDSAGNEKWARMFGSATLGGVPDVAVDESGVYIVGTTGAGSLNGQPTNPDSNYDGYIVKYGSGGEIMWTRIISGMTGTVYDVNTRGVAIDRWGNVCVVGDTRGRLADAPSMVGGTDAYIRCFNSTGDILWTAQFGTADLDTAYGIVLDNDGDAYVVGSTTGLFPGESKGGSTDAYIRKFSTGREQWTRQFGQGGTDSAAEVELDASGNVFVVGYTEGMFAGASTAGGVDAYVRKYNNTGTDLWTRQVSTPATEYGRGLAIDSHGNATVVGTTEGTFPSQVSAGEAEDAFVQTFDSAGNAVYVRQFGTSGFDAANAVAVDSAGLLYVVGGSYGTLPNAVGTGPAFMMRFLP
jgi:hypothetical protein